MAQKFLIVGRKAYRAGHEMEAINDPEFTPGRPVIELETTARVNELFLVNRYKLDELELGLVGQMWSNDIAGTIGEPEPNVYYTFDKFFVMPFIEKKERIDKGQSRTKQSAVVA